jgi:replicative DNA helicase
MLACTTALAPMPSQVRNHAENIVLFWQLRHTLDLANVLAASVLDFSGREKFKAAVGDVGQRLIRFGRREAVRTLEGQIDAVKADVLARAAGKEDRSAWVYTGIKSFDDRCHPLNSAKGDGLTVVAGASGHGKSAYFRQVVWAKLQANGRALVYTRETDIESYIEQTVASACEIDLLNVPDYARLYPDRMEKFGAECDRLRDEVANRRLWVVQHEEATPLETIEQLARHYRAHAHLHGHPDMVVVDYLQLFSTSKRCNSREEVVAAVSHTLQALQRESGILWLVGCQYNESGIREMRAVRRDADGRTIHRLPNAGDLRESQSIYHDTDRCICLYRPPEDCRGADNWSPNTKQPEIWLCQIKRRKGGLGLVKCWFEARYTRFTELGRADVIQSEQNEASGGKVPESGMSKADWRRKKGKQ